MEIVGDHTAPDTDSSPAASSAFDSQSTPADNSTTITSPTPSTSAQKYQINTRSSTRTKQARKQPSQEELVTSGDKGKGKAKDTEPIRSPPRKKRKVEQAAVTAKGLVIQEPKADPKGKKRAQPEPDPLDILQDPPSKRTRSSTRAARNTTAAAAATAVNPTTKMTKKSSRSSHKGKEKLLSKEKAAAGDEALMADELLSEDEHLDTSVDVDDHAVDVADLELTLEKQAATETEQGGMDVDKGEEHEGEGEEGKAENDDRDDDESAEEAVEGEDVPEGLHDEARNLFGLLGGDFTQLGQFFSNMTARLKQLLSNIKQKNDPTTRVIALQELSELLSVSNEDTLHSFSVDSFVTELVKIMGGSGKVADDDSDKEQSDNEEPTDPDAALAAAIALSEGEMIGGDIPEAQLLACRCLANLMEAIPGSAHTIVYHGAVPVLCSKLLMITDIDLAEQTLSTMEKISEEYPSALVREGGLGALLNMLDFFPTSVQRIAMQAAANCCRNLPADSFQHTQPIFPVLKNTLGSSDQRLVEYAALCVIRMIESYHRSAPDNLTTLLDGDFMRAIGILLLPASNSPLLSTNTYTLFIRALASAAKASAKTVLALLDADILQILYQLLTGVLPPAVEHSTNEQGDAESGQGLGGGVADMTIMENLAHRSKDQIEEALSLVSELMPPLPKDGVFDSRTHIDKEMLKTIKAKTRQERVMTRAQAASTSTAAQEGAGADPPSTVTEAVPSPRPATENSTEPNASEAKSSSSKKAESKPDPLAERLTLLRTKPNIVNRFIRLILPVLVDVYSASVIINVRIRCMSSILKAVNFLDGGPLITALTNVPIASFSGSILASTDHFPLVMGALQLVELLLTKSSQTYRASFRREGVLHAIETISSRKLSHKSKEAKDKDKSKEKEDKKESESAATSPEPPAPTPAPLKRNPTGHELQDAITVRAKFMKLKYLTSQPDGKDDAVLASLRASAKELIKRDLDANHLSSIVTEIAQVLSGSSEDVSTFELRQSGLVESLLAFLSEGEYNISLTQRKDIFNRAFEHSKEGIAVLVKRLQELLTRTEGFEVRSVAPGYDDTKHRSASMLARSVRLKLAGDESSSIPKAVMNMTVSIQAIATFQALNDYLRPRLSGHIPALGVHAARLNAMLALAESKASAYLGTPSSSTKTPLKAEVEQNGDTASSTVPKAGEPSSSTDKTPARRRSQRLSAKQSSEFAKAETTEKAGTEKEESKVEDVTETTAEPSEPIPSEPPELFDDPEPDCEPEVVEDPDEEDLPEKTVNVAVSDDGSKVEAKTPQGTRVATPNPNKQRPPPTSTPSGSRGSYAAALRMKPQDWHLQFSIDSHDIQLDATIFGALYQHELRKAAGNAIHPSSIWSGAYTVKFKKVDGPAPLPVRKQLSDLTAETSSSPQAASTPPNALCSQTLRLLRLLNELNNEAFHASSPTSKERALTSSAFVNNKLTAKLVRQLEETMIVASSCLPEWALDLPQRFSFLFPFSTRYSFLQSTSFGYARLILKWQSQQDRSSDTLRRDEGFGHLGRLQRQKVRISRQHLLESAVKVFELYGSSSSILEVEYFEEVGTGLGPTLEFYSLASREFARRDLKLWHDVDSTTPGQYVHHPHGLYPAPTANDTFEANRAKRTQLFQVVGQFVAKALLDSRIIDLSLNKIFLRLILGETVPLTIDTLRLVDPTLAQSLYKVQECKISACPKQSLEELSLSFTIPGYDIELRPDGGNTQVTDENVDEYIREILDALLGQGVATQIKAFRDGFSKVFLVSDMRMFTVDELAMLFGNGEEDWSSDTLTEVMKADHGYTMDSPSIRHLISLMGEFNAIERRQFLQFITGSPKLPIGGFRGLNPAFTVVRKPHEAPLTADDYLPSVMTCVNYLKLPEYTSRGSMKNKLGLAVKEGVHSGFHLS